MLRVCSAGFVFPAGEGINMSMSRKTTCAFTYVDVCVCVTYVRMHACMHVRMCVSALVFMQVRYVVTRRRYRIV